MMKAFRNLAIAILFVSACQSEPSKTVKIKEEPENMDNEKTLVVPWNVQINDSTHAIEIRRDPAADMANLQPLDIVDALNIKYPDIKMSWNKQEGNTAFVTIADAAYLTQQTGSEGAQAYLAEATYSLTEFKGITAVDFSFNEGDHAQPGVYTRADFSF